jgi:hypothetical protein
LWRPVTASQFPELLADVCPREKDRASEAAPSARGTMSARRATQTREEFTSWLARGHAKIFVEAFAIVACTCGDMNCHGWRLVPPFPASAVSSSRAHLARVARCVHVFVGSRACVTCGWIPPHQSSGP